MTEVDHKLFFNIEVDGQPIAAHHGQTVAAALIAAGRRVFRYTQSGAPRSLFCGMGVCFDCLVTVDRLADQRACLTQVRPGMKVHLPTGPEELDGCH